MINQLVINGCSYNEVYATGPGPAALAQSLGIENYKSISLGGSANSRIIRTTLKHSYRATQPTFYIVGLTFIDRWELPILESWAGREFEGRWINPRSQRTQHEKLQLNWTERDTETFTDLCFKSVTFAQTDQFEDLVYRCLSMINDIQSRGHQILVFNNCNDFFGQLVNSDTRFSCVKNNSVFVDGLNWTAIPWQHAQGARATDYGSSKSSPLSNFKHILPEDYKHLNSYLTNYIKEHKILERPISVSIAKKIS